MRRARWLAWWVGVALVPFSSAWSSPSDTLLVEGAVSPAVVKIGERVTVRFILPLPRGGKRVLGPPAPVELGPIDIVNSEPVRTAADSAGWQLEAAFFEVGEVDVSRIPFRLETDEGDVVVRLRPYTISVVSSLPDSLTEADIRPIKGPVDVPRRWRWGPIAGTVVAAVVLAGGMALWWRRRRQPAERAIPFVPDLPPDVIALRALRELEEQALPARGEVKEHYARLSLILRHYLQNRFRLAAVESTTEEIDGALERDRQLRREDAGALLHLFAEADLVKFAKLRPGPPTAGDALERGRAWLNRVAPRPREGEA
jgi:hypothetical protein